MVEDVGGGGGEGWVQWAWEMRRSQDWMLMRPTRSSLLEEAVVQDSAEKSGFVELSGVDMVSAGGD